MTPSLGKGRANEQRFKTRQIRPLRGFSVEGGVDAEMADKLIEIAAKCPVHRTLEARSAVVTKVADSEPRV